jgi:hypothetical protein
MTLCLTALERAALKRISSDYPGALEAQLATALVERRENSGAGFFTYLIVDRSTKPITGSERVFGNVAVSIEGFKQPILFSLFTEQGYAFMLEGATIDESTVGLEPTSLQLTIRPG